MLEFCFIDDMVQLALKKEGCDIGKDFQLEISMFPLISINCDLCMEGCEDAE